MALNRTLLLELVPGTRYTFDVSENWTAGGGDFVWFARLVLDPSSVNNDIRVTRGQLTLGQLSAVRIHFRA